MSKASEHYTQWMGLSENIIVIPRRLTDAERRALVYAPFPVVRINTPKGHSQAPNTALALTHIQDGDY